MSDNGPVRKGAQVRGQAALSVFARELCVGIANKLPPDLHLELVSFLVTWAVAERAQPLPWPALPRELNDTIGSSVAAGLDAGYAIPAHTSLRDTKPPSPDISLSCAVRPPSPSLDSLCTPP